MALFSISVRRERKMQRSLLEFVEVEREKQVDETLYYSNWYNSFYNACINNGIDPDELRKKSFPKNKRRK